MKRYLIYYDDLETWELVCDDHGCCAVERTGQRAKLMIPLEAFRMTEDGVRLADQLSAAVARATADSPITGSTSSGDRSLRPSPAAM